MEAKLKTAEEIFQECADNSFVFATQTQAIKAMKLYANQKLDEAKFNVSLRETNVYSTPDIDQGFADGIEAAIESIELLKDKI